MVLFVLIPKESFIHHHDHKRGNRESSPFLLRGLLIPLIHLGFHAPDKARPSDESLALYFCPFDPAEEERGSFGQRGMGNKIIIIGLGELNK